MEAWCGSLSVPEDPARPAGRQIRLAVRVIPAAAADPAPDALFGLAGGPGGAATTSLGWLPATFQGIHESRDIVLVDQRGTGGSNQLDVTGTPDTTGMSDAKARSTVEVWAHSFLASLGADPRFYTTSVAMDDLDLVRQALGYERIDLYGPSYGATAAQYYMRQHGDHVRAVVLDGGTPLDVPIFEHVAASSQAALDSLFARCAADAACHSAYPDVAGEFRAVWDRLPVTTSVTDPATGRPLVIDRVRLASGVHEALLTATSAARLPMLIHAAFLGRWDEIAGGLSSGGGGPLLVMSLEIRCSEAWARFDPAEVSRLGAGSYDLDAQIAGAEAQAQSCVLVPQGVVPADDAQPVHSDIPTLLLVGGADPQDPPALLGMSRQVLSNSRLVVMPGQGHTVGHLGCMPGIVDAFVRAGSVVGLDASCIDAGDNPLPAFAG
jgi:pimeloyl-ACP methyl ester carboxylesterase